MRYAELFKKKLIIIVSLIVCVFFSAAQNTPLDQITIASPTAASLGKYADIPVHYHTGVPQISIPIYTIKEGPLTVPVSLSYHSAGLKVLEPASAVGTGWALNAGGVITRTVVGAPDDRGLLAALTKYGHFQDYGYNSYLFLPSETGCGGTAPPCPVGSMHPANDQGIANQIRDGEPDLYFFNFNGYTGKFYFNDDRTPMLVPQQDLKIEPVLAPETGTVPFIYMQGFIITTPDGTKYFFGKNQLSDGNIDAIETTTSINTHSTNITNQGAVSSWFLNRIVSADDQFSVRFIYQQEKYSHYTISTHPIWNIENMNTFNSPYGNYEYDLAKNFINGVRLEQIIFSTGTVNFSTGFTRGDLGDFDSKVLADVPNTQAASLGAITINGSNGFCKKYNLHQTYFQDNNSPVNGFYANNYSISSDRYRLRLDSIRELSCDGSIQLPSHTFEYFSEGSSNNFAPRLLTFGQDHWGFYNGVLFNQQLVPTYFLNNIPVEGADRDSHWPAMRTGVLKKIAYPTGGTTQFDYEPNDTYGTIFDWTKVQALSISCGYDGSTQNSTTYAFSGNMYEVNLSNANSGSLSNLVIEDAGNNIVFAMSTNPGQSKTEYVTLSAGTYTIRITKNTTFTGQGTGAQFYQWAANNTTGNLMVGGLRIKTITRNDGLTGNNIVTNYTYKQGAGTQSSGILYSRPTYVSLLRNNIVQMIGGGQTPAPCSFNGCTDCDGSTNHRYYKSGGSIFPMTTTQGNHIGYDEVKVSQTGNGYSIFRYYGSTVWGNIDNDIVNRRLNNSSCDVNSPNYPPAPLPFEFKRGDLKYEGHFTEEGKAVKEAYYYPEYITDKVRTPGYKVAFLGGPNNLVWGTEYEVQTARKSKLEVISFETDEVTGAYVTNATRDYYNSPWHNEVTRHVTFASSGDSIIKINKYARDFRISDCDNISDGWSTYLTAYNNAASTFSSSLNCTSGSWNCRWLAFQQFRFDKSVARINYVNYRRTNFVDPGNAFAACRINAKNAADAQLKPILELQDEFKNAGIESSEWRNNELTGATFTSFDFAVSPSTKVYPAKIRHINLSASSGFFTDAATSANNQSLVTDSRYEDESMFRYSGGKLTEAIPKNGVPIGYIWGYANSLPIAKTTNATSTDVAFTSFENGSPEGNWTITGNNYNTSQKITGERSYDLAGGQTITANVTPGKQYLVSYWSRNGAVTVQSNGNVIPSNFTGASKNGWTYFEHHLPGTTMSVALTAANATIDELRLYPLDAEMETYCYKPMIGMSSSCDARNRVTYYEFDALGRLVLLKDQDNNVIKTIEYHYRGQH